VEDFKPDRWQGSSARSGNASCTLQTLCDSTKPGLVKASNERRAEELSSAIKCIRTCKDDDDFSTYNEG
jgi:hypothetical protein